MVLCDVLGIPCATFTYCALAVITVLILCKRCRRSVRIGQGFSISVGKSHRPSEITAFLHEHGEGALINHYCPGVTRGKFSSSVSVEPLHLGSAFHECGRRQHIGKGITTYHKACRHLKGWTFIDQIMGAWVQVFPGKDTQISVETKVFKLPLWCLVANVITYVINDEDVHLWNDAKGTGTVIAYSTLMGHPLSGEECFAVLWNHETDDVFFEVFSISRPSGVKGMLGRYFGMPILQKRFVEQVTESMCRLMKE